ncbi:MAG TPA: PPK2 family polyphosphate kinase [Bryobacteraceae bacterium]|nr:PPK2 family polyphosphate kinase [Bryobacteraceae bacterium]
MPDQYLAPRGDSFVLSKYDPEFTFGKSEAETHALLERNRTRIAELQNILYAESKRSLLIVLQSMDTGGKDPIIRDVLSSANPQACRVTAFKKASASEKKRGQFWRFFQEVPALGEIGAFNRSYYDELIRHHAHDDISAAEREASYRRILLFEQLLVESGTTIVKLFLHISKAEQKRRLQARMDNPERHWELSEADFEERKYWDGYMRAYEEAIRHTNVDYAPWYVITSDKSWYRDAAASVIVAEVLQRMNPQFPPPKVDLSSVELVD